MKLSDCLLAIVVNVLFISPLPTSSRHTDIVLLGSTGNLAQKYLWQSFYNLFSKYYKSGDQTLKFYGGGRSQADTKLKSILDKNVVCHLKDVTDCVRLTSDFNRLVSYIQLNSETDFQKLGNLLKSNKKYTERDVIFYLSIPPEAYNSTAKHIYNYCYPKDKSVKFRIVFEKPFGHDLSSAKHLVLGISNYFEEKEVFRIDHYLGKSVVRQILPFRMVNPEIEKYLNKDHVERVEIVLKEIVDSKGRISYYNKNGVLRDIIQNHLMEVMTLVAMDLPSLLSSMDIKRLKLKLLSEVEPVKSSAFLFGQYSEYVNQSVDEMPGFKGAEYVPTFAAGLLSINSPRWSNVPFVLVSGKQLKERTSYARVVLRQNTFCISPCSKLSGSPQIIFHIGHGNLETPMILVSNYFQNITFPNSMRRVFENFVQNEYVYDSDFSDFSSAAPSNNADAYISLIDDIFNDVNENFVGSRHLVKMWSIWDKALKSESHKPRIYQPKDWDHSLDFKIVGSKLQFIKDVTKSDEDDMPQEIDQTPTRYLGHKMVCSDVDRLLQLLAENIFKTVSKRSQDIPQFHIAFSGGQTPQKLFEIIAQSYSDLPWKFIHIWQVDERCVRHHDDESNFNHLWQNLLKYVDIPYDNIHPMPVEVNGRLCNITDNGHFMYEEAIEHYVPNIKFDYIVLGLGTDGHTASLFPHTSTLDSNSLVAIAATNVKPQRMTMTYSVINQAKKVSVLVTGREKQKILKLLENSAKNYADFPILGVKPQGGHMTWYVDNDTFFDDGVV